MPRRRSRITLAPSCMALLAAACSPSRFVWSNAPEAELDRYLASFATACGTDFDRRASYEEMLEAIAGSRILWLGDHHQSERLHVLQCELLRHLQERDAPFVLMLEAIATQDDAVLQSYLRGERTLPELRRDIAARWAGSWLDDDSIDAAYYREVLAFAKAHRIAVIGLEPAPRAPLHERDAAIVARVRDAVATWPNHSIVVLVGQAHLLGEGNLVARTGLGGVAIGGVPPARLRDAAPRREDRGFWRSTGGLWWFGDLFADARGR